MHLTLAPLGVTAFGAIRPFSAVGPLARATVVAAAQVKGGAVRRCGMTPTMLGHPQKKAPIAPGRLVWLAWPSVTLFARSLVGSSLINAVGAETIETEFGPFLLAEGSSDMSGITGRSRPAVRVR